MKKLSDVQVASDKPRLNNVHITPFMLVRMRMRILYTRSGLYSRIRKETLFLSYRRTSETTLSCIRKKNHQKFTPRVTTSREYKNYNPLKMNEDFAEIDWNGVFNESDVNKSVELQPSINFSLQNYSTEHTPTELAAGGALLYISNHLTFNLVKT